MLIFVTKSLVSFSENQPILSLILGAACVVGSFLVVYTNKARKVYVFSSRIPIYFFPSLMIFGALLIFLSLAVGGEDAQLFAAIFAAVSLIHLPIIFIGFRLAQAVVSPVHPHPKKIFNLGLVVFVLYVLFALVLDAVDISLGDNDAGLFFMTSFSIFPLSLILLSAIYPDKDLHVDAD